MSDKIVKNWESLAEYDIVSAKVMLEAGRYLYVAFMCQQSAEKMLKACFVNEKKKTPPYTHNLIRIAEELSFFKEIPPHALKDLELLNSHYIVSRYSEDIEEFSKTVTPQRSKYLYDFTEEFIRWLKSQM